MREAITSGKIFGSQEPQAKTKAPAVILSPVGEVMVSSLAPLLEAFPWIESAGAA
jgi:hypothetical protein